MENFYLIDYIKQNFDIDEEMLDIIKFELDNRLYYYGDHFYCPKEFSGNYKAALWVKLRHTCAEYSCILRNIFKNRNANRGKNIISNAYFTVTAELENIGYNVYTPPLFLTTTKNFLTDMQFYKHYKSIKGLLDRSDFADLISKTFFEQINDFKKKLGKFYVKKNISALIVPNDMSFWENLAIKVSKEIRRPSFVFLHGLPGRYNNIDENRADYLIVWGDKIKEHYVKAGVPKEKILVSGHPYYKEALKSNLRFDLENVLVITKSMNGAQSGKGARLNDRGNSILYLYSVQSILKAAGVRSARFRIHPCENSNWYMKFIDNEFFKLDKNNLSDSLKAASLVIGPTSTVLLEAVYYGVNYAVYEPCINDIDLVNFKLVPPFDGSDGRVPIAKSENELMALLMNRIKIDALFFKDYIKTPFDISCIKKYI